MYLYMCVFSRPESGVQKTMYEKKPKERREREQWPKRGALFLNTLILLLIALSSALFLSLSLSLFLSPFIPYIHTYIYNCVSLSIYLSLSPCEKHFGCCCCCCRHNRTLAWFTRIKRRGYDPHYLIEPKFSSARRGGSARHNHSDNCYLYTA